MARQYLVGGAGFVLEDGSEEYFLGGEGLVVETQTSATPSGTIAQTVTHFSQAASGTSFLNASGAIASRLSGFSQAAAGQGGDPPAVTTRQFFVPGFGLFLQNDTDQLLIPGGAFVNQAQIGIADAAGIIVQHAPKARQAAVGLGSVNSIVAIAPRARQDVDGGVVVGGGAVVQVLGRPTALFICDGATFDGANDYLQRGAALTGAASSPELMFATLFRRDGNPEISEFILAENGQKVLVSINTSGQVEVVVASAATPLFAFRTASGYCDGSYKHLLVSINTDSYSGDKTGQIAINGDPVSTVVLSDAYGPFDIDLTQTNWFVGAGVSGANKFTGDLAEFWMDAGTALDLDDPESIERFWVNSAPISLGDDGSDPLGETPLIYLHLDDGEAANNFAINRGAGGGFTLVGSLATSSQEPTQGEIVFFSGITQAAVAREVFAATVTQRSAVFRSAGIGAGVDSSRTGEIVQIGPAAYQQGAGSSFEGRVGTIDSVMPAARQLARLEVLQRIPPRRFIARVGGNRGARI